MQRGGRGEDRAGNGFPKVLETSEMGGGGMIRKCIIFAVGKHKTGGRVGTGT